MAKRLIDDSILTSPDFIDLGLKERWLWLGLCLITDDYGWANADPRFLRSRIAPSLRMSDAFILQTLEVFSARRMLLRRTFDGTKCLRLLNFNLFQKLKRKRCSKYQALEENRRERKEREGTLSPDELGQAMAEHRDRASLERVIATTTNGMKS